MRQLAVKSICLLFLLAQTSQPFAATIPAVSPIVLAQLGVDTIDLDPPEVDHIPTANGFAGTPQSINVKASDEQGIASVTLLYRYSQAAEYKRVLMRRIGDSDNYMVTLEPGPEQSMVEYYFLVIDIGGNKVLNGFPYKPFTRTFIQQLAIEALPDDDKAVPLQPPPAKQTTAQTSAEVPAPQAANQGTSPIIWAVLGALVLGALAASGGGDQPSTTAETVPVVFDIPLP